MIHLPESSPSTTGLGRGPAAVPALAGTPTVPERGRRTPASRAWCRSVFSLLLAVGGLDALQAQSDFTDTTPPTVVEFALDTTTVDVTGGPAGLTVRMRLTDDLSGVGQDPNQLVDLWYLYAYSANWEQYVYLGYWQFSLVEGDPMNGVWEGTLTIPQYAKSGAWRISAVQVSDLVGNTVWLSDQALRDLGFVPDFEVVSVEDVTPPEIVALDLEPDNPDDPTAPARIDTSLAGEVVTITATMRDLESGVAIAGPPNWDRGLFATLYWQMPDGNYATIWSGAFSLVEDGIGTPQEGTWQGSVYFPQYSQRGFWQLEIYGYDQAGNYFVRSWESLQEGGLPSQVEVVSDPSDTAPPVLTSLGLSPVTIDTSGEDQVVTASMHATDELSGVTYGWVYLRSPSGAQYRWVYLPGWDAADPLAVDLEGTTVFPRYSEAGTWHVEWIYLYDRVNNWRYLTRDELESLGFNTSLNVVLPSLETDGTVDGDGGTVVDEVFGDRAQVTIPPGVLTEPTTVAIDVLQDPLEVDAPAGFAAPYTHYVNIHLEPEPETYPLGEPGLTVVLPLVVNSLPEGTVLYLFRVDPATGQLVPAIRWDGNPVTGTVDVGGWSATFTGISQLSTVVALLPDAVVTWPVPAHIVYGTALSDTQLNADANMEGTYEYSPPPDTILGAGQHLLSVTFTPADPLYRAVTTAVPLEVERAELTVTAEDKSKAFGAALPAFTATYDGFVNDEDESVLDTPVSLTTTADAFSPPGTYPITVSDAADPNYTIIFVSGTLTVNAPGAIQLVADPDAVPQSSATQVRFQMYVPTSPSLLGSSLNLQYLQGGTWVVVGAMYDDGTHGDLAAGDSTYSLLVVVDQATAGGMQFRGSVGYKRQLKRTPSNQVVVEVIANQ